MRPEFAFHRPAGPAGAFACGLVTILLVAILPL